MSQRYKYVSNCELSGSESFSLYFVLHYICHVETIATKWEAHYCLRCPHSPVRWAQIPLHQHTPYVCGLYGQTLFSLAVAS